MTAQPTLLALYLALAAAPALADDDCTAPVQQWQSREAVRQLAQQLGWQVQRLKIDDGCYEIRGKDGQGRTFKAKIDPETLKVIKFKPRDRDREHQHERDREPERTTPARPGGAPPPLFQPGTAPRGQVE